MNLQAGALFFTPQMLGKHLEIYTDREVDLIKKDLEVIRGICFENSRPTNSRFYLATAGAPGARKTTILEKFIETHPEYQMGVYVDPDARALRFMVHTYYAQSLTPLAISKTSDYGQVIKNAYHKWRPGSNYISLTLFEEAAAKGLSIIHGTTLTGTHIPTFFAKLKENGYQIVLLLCSCSDNFRQKAIEYRNQVVRFYQSSPEEAIAKGKFFSQKIGTYFAYADLIYFYWSDDLFTPECLAAVWQKGALKIHDKDAMERFVEKYEMDREALAFQGKILPPFKNYLGALHLEKQFD